MDKELRSIAHILDKRKGLFIYPWAQHELITLNHSLEYQSRSNSVEEELLRKVRAHPSFLSLGIRIILRESQYSVEICDSQRVVC